MRYILPPNTLHEIRRMRKRYQRIKNMDINEQSSFQGWLTMFGETDLIGRRKQIEFLEKIYLILKPNLKRLDRIKSPEELMVTGVAWRIYIIACLYVQSQNSSSSELNKLIDKSLGIDTINFMDQEDKNHFFATAYVYVNTKNAFQEANIALTQAKQVIFDKEDWKKFKLFIEQSHQKKFPTNPFTNYPITSVTQPLFKSAFTLAASSIGSFSEKVPNVLPAQYQLTTWVGASVLIFGQTGSFGTAIFAPIVANKLVSAFSNVTLRHIFKNAMGYAGYGAGTLVGGSLDLAFNILYKMCSLISNYQSTKPEGAPLTGLRLSDGQMLLEGIPVTLLPVNEISKIDKIKQIELKEDGALYVGGQAVFIPDAEISFTQEVLDELYAFSKEALEKEHKPSHFIEEENTAQMPSISHNNLFLPQ